MNNSENMNHDTYWANLWILLAYSENTELSSELKETIKSNLTKIRQEIVIHTDILLEEIDSALNKIS